MLLCCLSVRVPFSISFIPALFIGLDHQARIEIDKFCLCVGDNLRPFNEFEIGSL